jgi:hypothetical protein
VTPRTALLAILKARRLIALVAGTRRIAVFGVAVEALGQIKPE